MAEKHKIVNARRLRVGSTEAEARMWARLRARQVESAEFVRQHPIGPYIVDFCCRSAKLVIEIDGGQHADDPRDSDRTDAICEFGYLMLRFWNKDVLGNTDGVIETIADMLRILRDTDR